MAGGGERSEGVESLPAQLESADYDDSQSASNQHTGPVNDNPLFLALTRRSNHDGGCS